MRRLFPVVPPSTAVAAWCAAGIASLHRRLSTSDREDLSRVVSAVQGEAKGQAVDLVEMGDAARNSLKQIQEASARVKFDDARLKAKVTTLQTALKAYSSRVANVQNEARSLQGDAERVLKMLYGESETAASGATTATTTTTATSSASASAAAGGAAAGESDFHVEPPAAAQKLEEINRAPPGSQGRVETATDAAARGATTVAEDEIVVETLDDDASGAAAAGAADDSLNRIRADETTVSEITATLHERGIDFGDCRDARQLRQRYKDFLDGKFAKPDKPAPRPEPNRDQPSTPPRYSPSSGGSSYQQQQQQQQQQRPPYQQQQPIPNTTETGLQPDPHPGAVRKQIDTQKFVREVKEEIAREHGVSAGQIDLWSGMTLLEDNKRLYEYSNLQNNPIEVRQKGDFPRPR
jgi:hypothetical protein